MQRIYREPYMSHDLGAVAIFRFLELELGLGLDWIIGLGLGLRLGLGLGFSTQCFNMRYSELFQH